MPLKELLLGWQKKLGTAVDQERRLEKVLKDLAMLKTICVNHKVLEPPYAKTVFQNKFQSMLRGRKLQFAIMPLYGPTKLLD